MGGELAEPGWASACGERSTGEDANSTPPWDLQEDQDQDQGTEEDIGSTGRGQGSTGRGQDLGPSGPCTGRSSSGPSGLFTRRRRRLEDPKQGQAPSVPGLQPSYQARQTSQGRPPHLIIVDDAVSYLPGLRPPHPRLQAYSRMRAVQWVTQEHRVRWETYHCDLCDEDGHGRRWRFCRSHPQPTKPKRKDPQDDAMDTAPPAPTTSVATTQTAQATCTIGTQVDIPTFADLTEWRPSHNRDVKIRQQDWLDHANFEDITGRQDAEGYLVDLQVNVPFPAANEVLARQLAKSGISGHDCKDPQCISATRHLISVPISKALRVYARALDTDIELQTSSTSQVFLKSIAGRKTRDSDKLRHFIPKISPPVIDPFAAEFARLGIPKLPV